MFDPKHAFDQRLASEMGLYEGDDFLPVPKGSETELKFLTDPRSSDDFLTIRSTIHQRNNRVLDPRTIEIKRHALVTLNIDTLDQKLRHAGLTGRVRFAFDPYNPETPPYDIDISVKTLLSDGNIIYLNNERGEWEGELNNLTPNLFQIFLQNNESLKKGDKPVPALIQSNIIKPDDLFVESVGCTWRGSYITGHRLDNMAAIYAHTEDYNLFTTPYCDQYKTTITDNEAEAELQGWIGSNLRKKKFSSLEQQTQTSLRKTQLLIEQSSPSIQLNRNSKNIRAQKAIIHAYSGLAEYTLESAFANQAFSSSAFALSQQVRTSEVRFQNLSAQLIRMRKTIDKQMSENSFRARNFGNVR